MLYVVASSGYALPIYYGHSRTPKRCPTTTNLLETQHLARCIQCSSCFVFVARSIMHRKISCHFESRYMYERVSPINDCNCVALASAWSIWFYYSPSSDNLMSPFSVSSTIPKNGNTAWRGTLYLVDFLRKPPIITCRCQPFQVISTLQVPGLPAVKTLSMYNVVQALWDSLH